MAVVEKGEEDRSQADGFPDDIWFGILRHIKDETTRNAVSLVCKKFYLLERNSRSFISFPFCTVQNEVMAKELLQRYPNLRHVAARLSRKKRPGRSGVRTDGDRLLRLLSFSSGSRRIQSLEIAVSDVRAIVSAASETPASLSSISPSWEDEDLPARKKVFLGPPSLEIFGDSIGVHLQELDFSACALSPDGIAILLRACKRLEKASFSCHLLQPSAAMAAAATPVSMMRGSPPVRPSSLSSSSSSTNRATNQSDHHGQSASRSSSVPPCRAGEDKHGETKVGEQRSSSSSSSYRRFRYGRGVDAIATCTSLSLRCLTLRCCDPDHLVLAIIDACPRLRALTIERCPLKFLVGLADCSCCGDGALEELTLSRLYSDDMDSTRTFMEWRGGRHVSELEGDARGREEDERGRMVGGLGEDDCLEAFALAVSSSAGCAGSLRHLSIQTDSKAPHQEPRFTGSGLVALACVMPRLESISLSSLCSIKDSQIGAVIDACHSLRRLSLRSLALFSQPFLRRGAGRGGRVEDEDGVGVGRASLTALGQHVAHGARERHLSTKSTQSTLHSTWSSSSTTAATAFTPLREIELIDCGDLSGRGFAGAMRGCGNSLTVLRLQDCNLETLSIMAIADHCKSLRKLDLRYEEGIRDGGAGAICEGCTQLSELRLWFCGVLCDTDMSDIARAARAVVVLAVVECPRLAKGGGGEGLRATAATLAGRERRLSKRGVEKLLEEGACPKLERLEVERSFLSERGRGLAKERHVQLRVYDVLASANGSSDEGNNDDRDPDPDQAPESAT